MASRPWLRQIKHQLSCGQSAAVRTRRTAMPRRTSSSRSTVTARMIRPSFRRCSRRWRRARRGVGLVAGQRTGRQATGFKKFQSRLANGVRGAVLRDGTRDTGCGLKAFRRDLFLALPYFDGLHRFLPALVRREGLRRSAYVDVVDRPRHAGTSNYGMWDRLWVGILDLLGRVVAHPPPASRARRPGGETEC